MKVQELIEELEKHDPDATVFVYVDWGAHDSVIVCKVKHNEYSDVPEGIIIDNCKW